MPRPQSPAFMSLETQDNGYEGIWRRKELAYGVVDVVFVRSGAISAHFFVPEILP